MRRFVSQHTSCDDNHILMIRMDNAKIISQIFKTINFKEVKANALTFLNRTHDFIFQTTFTVLQGAVFCCSKDGLKVTVEDSKNVQLNAFLQPEIFQVRLT